MERRTYGAQELRDAAATVQCMSEMLGALGVEPTPGRRRHLSLRLRRLGVDLSHWDRSPRAIYDRPLLADAVAASTSIAGVLRYLGLAQAGGTQAHIGRRIRAQELDTAHFTGQAHGRGHAGSGRATAQDVLVVRPPGSSRVKTHLLKRLMLEAGVPHRCTGCGIGPAWRGQDLVLVIDHLNGDWLDNRLANLRFLCPNCHAQTATWCRTKGS